jgi:hypothetical protein
MLPIANVDAQDTIRALPRWMVSFHGYYLIPQSPVDRFLGDGAVGMQIEAQYRIQYNRPFTAGLFYGESGLSRYVLRYTQNTGDGDVDIKETANTRRLEAGITVGFYPELNWLLQPYLQGRFGFAIFQSSSIIKDRDEGEIIDRISESSNTVPAYALDIGVHIVPNIWYLRGDIRFGIAANPSATFLSLNESKKGMVNYPIEAFDEHTSAGQWLKVSVGISYLF